MTVLPNMGLTLPTRGAPGSGLWADALDAIMALIDAHSHASGQGVKVTPTGLNINGDLTFAGNGATNLGKLLFTAVTALSSGSKAIFVSSSDNELYWRTNGGTNVKITNGNALNVAAFIGGIGGDYTAVAAALNYDDANARYTLRGAAGTNWARMASGEVRIYETGTSETVYVGHAAPAALGASYTVTWPTAVPGSTQLVQMSSAGVLTASNTVANAVSLGSTLGVTGAATLTGGITNNVTLTSGATAAANQHITVSGTGEYKHGDRTMVLSAAAATPTNANFTRDSGGSGSVGSSGGSSAFLFGFPFIVGDRVKSLTVSLSGDGAVDITITCWKTVAGAAASATSLGTTTATNAAGEATHTIDITDTTLAAGEAIHVVCACNAANGTIYTAAITYDHP